METRSDWRYRLAIAACIAVVCVGASACRRERMATRVRGELDASLDCPQHAIDVVQIDGVIWRASGCGASWEYACWGRRDRFECRPLPPMGTSARELAAALGARGRASPPAARTATTALSTPARYGPAPAAPRPIARAIVPRVFTPAPDAWTPAAADAFFQSVAAPVRACAPARLPLALTIELGRHGRVAGVAGMEDLAIEEQLCVMSALQAAAVPGDLTRAHSARFEFR